MLLCLYSRRNIQQLNLSIENSKNLTGKRFAQKMSYRANNELTQDNICKDFLGKYLQRDKKLSIKEGNLNKKKIIKTILSSLFRFLKTINKQGK